MTGRAAIGLALALGLGCCGKDPAGARDDPRAERAWPAGTVLAVDDVAILRGEVDQAAARIAIVYPEHSASFHRRKALESFVLPRAALRSYYAAAREEAAAACAQAQRLLTAPLAGEDPPPVSQHSGNRTTIGFFAWGVARTMDEGAWSEPLEAIGHFVLLRLDARSGPGDAPAGEELTLSLLEFSYLPAVFTPREMDAAIGAVRLVVVDPEYDDLLPEAFRYRMRGDRP